MPFPDIAAAADLSLNEALALVSGQFDAEEILDRPIELADVEEYYRQSDRGYRLFHSREGALHIALGCDGHRDTNCYSRQAEIFREHLDAIGAERAIEFGCGMGFNTRWLAEHCADRTFVGLDLTESHIRHATKLAGSLANVEFVQGNYEALSYPENSFDAVLAVETLCQTPNLRQALAEAHRVLRPGGRLVVIDCFRSLSLEQFDPPLRKAARLVEKTTAVAGFAVVADWIALAESVGLPFVEDQDLSAETRQNLTRLYSLAKRFFKMPRAMRAMTKAFPPRLLENSICGLLMPYTVGHGAHTYRAITVEKR
ncbi:MAG: class I SAM-dependent methyltransferase [Planctomycetota bacterium]